MAKRNCLSKQDIKELISEYILTPVVIIISIALFLFIGRSIVKEIYKQGCFSTYELNEDFRGPSYQKCGDLFEGKKN